jgi:hypothetical protein
MTRMNSLKLKIRNAKLHANFVRLHYRDPKLFTFSGFLAFASCNARLASPMLGCGPMAFAGNRSVEIEA